MYGHMLKQVVAISSQTGSNDYGETTHGSATQQPARVELVNKSKLQPGGEVIPITAKVWVKPSLAVDVGDKLTYGENNYKVIGRTEVPNGQGKVMLVMLECTEWR